MSDCGVYIPSASFTESWDTSYLSNKKKLKLRLRVSPTKEISVRLAKISTKTDKDGFSPAVFRSSSEQKFPVTESFVRCVCFLFSLAKSILTMGSCVCFCSHNLSFFRTKCRECFTDVVVSALEFRCCREIP